jgi:hypothetical protein
MEKIFAAIRRQLSPDFTAAKPALFLSNKKKYF